MYRLYYYEVGHLLHDSFKRDCFDEVYLCQDDFLTFEYDMLVTNYFLILHQDAEVKSRKTVANRVFS